MRMNRKTEMDFGYKVSTQRDSFKGLLALMPRNVRAGRGHPAAPLLFNQAPILKSLNMKI